MRILLYTLFISVVLTSCDSSKGTIEKSSLENEKPTFSFSKITALSPRLTESSGLEYMDNNLVTHNDSGDTPTIYFIDKNGKEQKSFTYKNMTAIDWEDITKDEEFLYIADIGNNYGNRKDLTIYKIALQDLEDENAPVQPLHINYPDQKSFERGDQDHPYDAESIVAIGDYLYVFSKDWKDQTTIVYQIDKNKMNQSAQKVSSFNIKGLVTGATFNGTDAVMLCGYNSNLSPFVAKVHYEDGSFMFQDKEDLDLTGGAQVEAITYTETKNGEEIYYFSCEAFNIKLGEDEAKSAAQLFQLRYKVN